MAMPAATMTSSRQTIVGAVKDFRKDILKVLDGIYVFWKPRVKCPKNVSGFVCRVIVLTEDNSGYFNHSNHSNHFKTQHNTSTATHLDRMAKFQKTPHMEKMINMHNNVPLQRLFIGLTTWSFSLIAFRIKCVQPCLCWREIIKRKHIVDSYLTRQKSYDLLSTHVFMKCLNIHPSSVGSGSKIGETWNAHNQEDE